MSREVDIPGTEGDMGILPGHAPVLSTLRPGVVTVTKEGGQKERIFVRGGFAEVNPQGLTVLAEVAVPVAELRCRNCSRSRSRMRRKTSPTRKTTRRAGARRKISII